MVYDDLLLQTVQHRTATVPVCTVQHLTAALSSTAYDSRKLLGFCFSSRSAPLRVHKSDFISFLLNYFYFDFISDKSR